MEPRPLDMTKRLLLAAATLIVAVTATMKVAPERHSQAPEAVIAQANPPPREWVQETLPFHRERWLSPEGYTRSVHCSMVSLLPDGDLIAAWYGGQREGSGDVAVFTARWNAGDDAWSPPQRVIDRAQAEFELDRPVKKLGNTVVFPDQHGTLWMVYVSVMVGGWSGCSLNIKASLDNGQTWGESQRLSLNPYMNLSSLVRSRPVYASDGRIGLPIYHEMALKYPQVLWLDPEPKGGLRSYELRSLPAESELLQPVLVPLGQDRMLMLLRDGRPERTLRTAFSRDNGWTWSPTAQTSLPNPDAAVDAVRLRDGRILLAYNDATAGRDSLRLAVSTDAGATWSPGPVLEHEPKREFSYPSIIEDSRGRIHVTYTWRRERIKHLEFNAVWLDQATAQPRSLVQR
jgi:predicted neuraminidase